MFGRATLVLFVVGLLIAHAAHYMPFISDDSLISLRYAARLIAGEGLTWTDGRPVEGYSNLLWILLISVPGLLGADLIVAARALGVLGMAVAAVVMLLSYSRRNDDRPSIYVVMLGVLFFVSSAPVAVWAIGGLEQPLIAACLAAAIPLYWWSVDGRFAFKCVPLVLSFTLGCLCVTRPDGPLFTVAIVTAALIGSWLFRRRLPWSFLMRVVSVPALFYGAQVCFRLMYYGEWVPNTALVKLNPSSRHLREGLEYVWNGLISLAPMSLIALACLVAGMWVREWRERFLPLLLLLVLWLAYLVVIGGDIFPAYRHFVPVVVVMAYVLIEGVDRVWRRNGGRILVLSAMVVFLACSFLLTVYRQFTSTESRRAMEERWEWNARSLALTLKSAFDDAQPLLAVTSAGGLAYWSEFPCLDMLGLNDYYLPRHKPDDVGAGFLGHELGDGAYVLDRAPDIIIFNVGSGLMYRTGEDLSRNEDFPRQYVGVRLVTATPPSYKPLVWFRKRSPIVGIHCSESSMSIPGYLMDANGMQTAFLREGRLIVKLDKNKPIRMVIPGATNRWRARVVSRDADRIRSSIEPYANGVRLTLTTDSTTSVFVDSVILTPVNSAP